MSYLYQQAKLINKNKKSKKKVFCAKLCDGKIYSKDLVLTESETEATKGIFFLEIAKDTATMLILTGKSFQM